MAKFTLDYTGEQINEALGLALNGSADALKKTGDTMEGILKFMPDVHYGASLPETGETGQIYFVEAEEAFLENKDGVIKTSNVENKAITRAKLANDALYSPIGWNTEITAANIGQTMRINWNAATTFRLTQTNSSAIDAGAEIAFLRWGVADIDVLVVGSGGIRFALPGETGFKTNATLKIPETFGMIALKKIETSATNGDTWLVTGNVEVVS